jgi:sugar (pentulose or hexulose) kinase
MTFSSTSANLLEHYRNSLPDRPSFESLTREAETADVGDLRIEPYVDGEPIERCFRHVRPEHARGRVVRAIMEAVAHQLATQLKTLCGETPPVRVASAGGGARSGLWLRIKREILGVPCVADDCEEPTSRGAAVLGNAAVTGRDVPSVVAQWLTGPSSA